MVLRSPMGLPPFLQCNVGIAGCGVCRPLRPQVRKSLVQQDDGVGAAADGFGQLTGFYLRAPLIIAATTIFFGLVLWIGERYGEKKQHLVDLTLVQAIVIGIVQTLALIPGTSRVGITLTAALLLGLTSQAAATFSFLLSIPVIILAGGYELRMLILTGSEIDPVQMLFAMVVAFVSSLLVIHLFLKALTRIGLLPFVIYRLVLGVVLLWIFLPPYLSTLMP